MTHQEKKVRKHNYRWTPASDSCDIHTPSWCLHSFHSFGTPSPQSLGPPAAGSSEWHGWRANIHRSSCSIRSSRGRSHCCVWRQRSHNMAPLKKSVNEVNEVWMEMLLEQLELVRGTHPNVPNPSFNISSIKLELSGKIHLHIYKIYKWSCYWLSYSISMHKLYQLYHT